MNVKDIIKNRRIELGLTMKEVADKIGVSEGTISRWESGEIANMKRDKIMSLASALDISPAVIMGWEKAEPKKEEFYINPETSAIAEKIFKNAELRLLFEAAQDAPAEDLQTVYNVLSALKAKERND